MALAKRNEDPRDDDRCVCYRTLAQLHRCPRPAPAGRHGSNGPGRRINADTPKGPAAAAAQGVEKRSDAACTPAAPQAAAARPAGAPARRTAGQL